jgi:branched-chain amino acid transport system permease protein
VGLALGIALTLASALVLGWLTLRMSGHYLPLATIAWCLALYYTMGNLDALGKYDGLLGLPPIVLGPWSLSGARSIYPLIWICVLLAALAVNRLLDSRPGRIMRALNGSMGGGSTMPEAMGASSFRAKLIMFVTAALLASISGWLFAHMQRTVNPTPFGLNAGIAYLFMAVLGGIGSVWGALLGAVAVRLTEDQLQVLLPKLLGTGGNYEMIVFGVILVLVLKYAPRGLWSVITRRVRFTARTVDWHTANSLTRREQPAAGTVLLEARGLTRKFGGLMAVDGVDLTVHTGEIVGLIGPNGAGKSTTFHLLSGVLALSGGSIRFRNRKADGLPSRAMARMGMSRTFQHVKLVPEMSVLENVAVGCYVRSKSGAFSAMLRTDRAEERRAFKEAEHQLQRVGLGAAMHQKAGDLALGPQRLVEIARALASDPALLLLDEPAAGLRHNEKRALAQLLGQLRQEGLSMLLVEHDMDFVMGLTDRIVVMESGRKLMEGTPEDVQASTAVREAYLGTGE